MSERQDVDGAFEAQDHCVPVFIGERMKLMLEDPLLRDAGTDLPRLRNGTLTFLSWDGATYALTCRHVIEALRQEREQVSRRDNYGIVLPERFHAQLYVPLGQRHIHVNANFHYAPDDAQTGTPPDAAIARVSPGLPAVLGVKPISAQRLDAGTEERRGQNALAAGYIEAGRRLRERNAKIADLVGRFLQASAALTTIDACGLRMIHEFDHSIDADNLSGMSGGPIFWHHGARWGLAGIVKQGRDLQPKADGDSAFEKPTLWIEGERLSRERLSAWVAAIPGDDAPLEDCSFEFHIPKSLR